MATPELPVPDGLVLRPFRGVRFAVDDPAKVTSPPYDLISESDVRDLLNAHPNNVVRLILPCTPQEPTPSTAPEVAPLTPVAPKPTEPHSTNTPSDDTPAPSRSTPNPPTPMYDTRNTPHNPGHPHDPLTPRGTVQRGTVQSTATPSGALSTATPSGATAGGTAAGSVSPGRESAGAAEQRYGAARDTLRAWLASGVLVPDDQPALYVYEQSGPAVLQRGLIGDVCLADPAQGIVLPHEDVMPGPVADRLALMGTTQANLEPIFLLYNGSSGQATRLVDEVAARRNALVDLRTSDGVRHRLWAITDQREIDAVNADLHDRQALIADGHHRYATYRELQRQEHLRDHTLVHTGASQPWDFGLALLVDTDAYPPDLKAIHRVIPGLTVAEATARAKGSWQVHDFDNLSDGLEALDTADGPAFLLTDGEFNHLLTDPDPMQLAHAMPADHSERWNSLNTSVLTEFVLPKVWGMQDDEQAVRIVHHDPQAAAQLAARTSGTAVILRPLAVDDVLAIAAGGERVPRKSTSFGPKPRTGLVLRTFAME